MNNSEENTTHQSDDAAVGTANAPAAKAQNLVLDLIALRTDLLDNAASAQIALLNARGRGDQRGSDEALLQLRAAALLLASIPAPDPDARRFAVLAAALLAAEDDDASSYARLMVEHAIRLSDNDNYWVIERTAPAATSDDLHSPGD